jgi:16S rRNA (guanine966-N2)-methyltransferase
VSGSRLLDLFAGTGLMGIEALSRGAAELVLVDDSRKMVRTIESNLLKIGYQAQVICADVRKIIHTLEPESFDIIFADPPYKATLAEKTLELLDQCHLLKPGGILAVEHSTLAKLSDRLAVLERTQTREWGQTAISFYQHVEENG